jgi:hypothetical protein
MISIRLLGKAWHSPAKLVSLLSDRYENVKLQSQAVDENLPSQNH